MDPAEGLRKRAVSICERVLLAYQRSAAFHASSMFTVDEATADAIRRAYHESGELAAVVEFRRHFPLIDSVHAHNCVWVIARWQPLPDPVRSRK